ncbi:methylcobalamin:coenzyme M methyltransferase MtbA [Gottschalkia purinilytica]|uniref:Methylcobalamin:coenzyme M methyltransferase MtbA n=1 Tax=Gottschalkia purinilytica TaxID=1503 RepID=A0A0L0W7U4_GOTPU|nr:uroporphyrinogen decarboxylase family protein [Gottschalkia purinilytica]KNF07614.1 methylcobalamin:coenzyme M methyltransferase MtbA [Gottschalkia purinilytica]
MIHQKDKMTPKERLQAYFKKEEVDRLPFTISLGEPSAKFLGISSFDYHHKADSIVETEVFCFNRFGQDGISVRTGLHGIAEAMGSKLSFAEKGLAAVEIPFLSLEENFQKLRPADPHKDGRLPMFLEAIERLQEKLGDVVPISAGLPGPFTTLSSLRGPEILMRDLHTQPEVAFKWMDIIMESFYAYIDEAAKLGVGFNISEPVASQSLISPRMFRTYVKPYLKKCVDRMIEKSGRKPSLHICGQTQKILRDMTETGVGTLSLDNAVDMEKAKIEVGNDICLSGNVKPVETILHGTKEDIFNEVKDLVKKLHDNPKGYVIAPGCQLPMTITLEKIDMYAEAARKFGKFPIEFDLD